MFVETFFACFRQLYFLTQTEYFAWALLAYGTRARSARGSQNCAILSIICPFTGNSAFGLCVNDVVLGVPCRKDATEVFFCEVHTNKYIINTVLPSS